MPPYRLSNLPSRVGPREVSISPVDVIIISRVTDGQYVGVCVDATVEGRTLIPQSNLLSLHCFSMVDIGTDGIDSLQLGIHHLQHLGCNTDHHINSVDKGSSYNHALSIINTPVLAMLSLPSHFHLRSADRR